MYRLRKKKKKKKQKQKQNKLYKHEMRSGMIERVKMKEEE